MGMYGACIWGLVAFVGCRVYVNGVMVLVGGGWWSLWGVGFV